jgi:hypothetical protein
MIIDGVKFRIGTDPEVFVQHKGTGRMVGAFNMCKGTKRKPIPLSMYIKVQVDGMALEFNTYPARDGFGFSTMVDQGISLLHRLVSGKGDYQIVVEPTVEFDDEAWAEAPDSAKILGCEEDYNAWTMGVNKQPNAEVTFRTGGGHLHVGWGKDFEITDDFREVCGGFIREQDVTNGVASVLYDPDVSRRRLYGKAGAFRPKSYGVEYRTLSNYWVKEKELAVYVAEQSFMAASHMMRGKLLQTPEVEDIINNSNVEEAKYFLTHNKIKFPPDNYRME